MREPYLKTHLFWLLSIPILGTYINDSKDIIRIILMTLKRSHFKKCALNGKNHQNCSKDSLRAHGSKVIGAIHTSDETPWPLYDHHT